MDVFPPPLIPILRDMRCKPIRKGQIMLYRGDRTPDVYIIHSGIVKIYDVDEQGNEKVLQLVKRPAVIPFAFFSGSTVAAKWFYEALTDCEIYVVPQIKLIQGIRDDSNLALYLMNWFSGEVHEILQRLSSLGKSTARDKLFAALLSLVNRHSTERRGPWRRITFPVNHQLLADMTGITRESITVAMKGLQDDGMVRHPRVNILEVNTSKLTTPE